MSRPTASRLPLVYTRLTWGLFALSLSLLVWSPDPEWAGDGLLAGRWAHACDGARDDVRERHRAQLLAPLHGRGEAPERVLRPPLRADADRAGADGGQPSRSVCGGVGGDGLGAGRPDRARPGLAAGPGGRPVRPTAFPGGQCPVGGRAWAAGGQRGGVDHQRRAGGRGGPPDARRGGGRRPTAPRRDGAVGPGAVPPVAALIDDGPDPGLRVHARGPRKRGRRAPRAVCARRVRGPCRDVGHRPRRGRQCAAGAGLDARADRREAAAGGLRRWPRWGLWCCSAGWASCPPPSPT